MLEPLVQKNSVVAKQPEDKLDLSAIKAYDLGARKGDGKVDITSQNTKYDPLASCYQCHGCDSTCACICQQCQQK